MKGVDKREENFKVEGNEKMCKIWIAVEQEGLIEGSKVQNRW